MNEGRFISGYIKSREKGPRKIEEIPSFLPFGMVIVSCLLWEEKPNTLEKNISLRTAVEFCN